MPGFGWHLRIPLSFEIVDIRRPEGHSQSYPFDESRS
jgi:hypothetical protein